jgi:hypothetical protein
VNNALTPAQRLRASRQAISLHLHGQGQGRGRRGGDDTAPAGTRDDPAAPPPSGPAWWRIARHTLRAWWHSHPAYSAALVAEPVLRRYASDKPLHLVGLAAAAGAAAVWLKPWRLISVGAVLAATLKSQDMSRLMVSLLAQALPEQERRDEAS